LQFQFSHFHFGPQLISTLLFEFDSGDGSSGVQGNKSLIRQVCQRETDWSFGTSIRAKQREMSPSVVEIFMVQRLCEGLDFLLSWPLSFTVDQFPAYLRSWHVQHVRWQIIEGWWN